MSSNLEVAQCAPGQLWTPGLELDAEYPVPTSGELATAWSDYLGEPAEAVQGVFGAYRTPTEVRAIASIDLCEVVRESFLAVSEATGIDKNRRSKYGTGTWFSQETTSTDYMQSVVGSILRTAMREGYVQPVPYIDAIAATLRNWRQQGVYCVANTSTLPGCELPTIENTLARDLPGCFDALLLPRNHDGKGTITKAAALAIFAYETHIELSELPLVHIDDAMHHIQGFQDHFSDPDARLAIFAPKHGDNTHLSAELHTETSFEAFMKADSYFAMEGVTHAR